ncbi:MAG: glycine--tRNA ligase [Candidatus Taylorbacteria bacterium]|nr:glycine--tRNA ligase [Candidatus Taylorbacteria bacterium]
MTELSQSAKYPENAMEKIISLCKRKGFVYQGSEIYGGLAGTWDYGPLGVALKQNIQNLWWKKFVLDREDMYGVDAAILMNQEVWKASGHVGGFSDPLVEDLKTKKRYRADHLLEEVGVDPRGMNISEMDALIKEKGIKSPEGNALGDVRQFNMMFKTHVGATQDEASISYLRPETAQGIFVNFKNVVDSFHPKLPFGIAQIGKAFRNEIAPRDFIFRVRELEQMEIEYFIRPEQWEEIFESLYKEQLDFLYEIGLSKDKLHKIVVPEADRAHYSKHSVDTEFDFPFGQKELLGLAYRTDFDLKAHQTASGTDISYFDEAEIDPEKKRLIPHCIEPTFGVGRLFLAVLSNAYTEDNLGGEPRAYLKLSPKVAPVLVAVSPLLKNKPQLVEKAREIYTTLRKVFPGRVLFDDNGNIGKRYRRQDEIGTPFCVVVDFDTVEATDEKKDTVTIRFRDTGEQERIAIPDLVSKIQSNL